MNGFKPTLIMINERERPGGGGARQWSEATGRCKRRPRRRVHAEQSRAGGDGGGVSASKDRHVDTLLHIKNRGLPIYGTRKSVLQPS